MSECGTLCGKWNATLPGRAVSWVVSSLAVPCRAVPPPRCFRRRQQRGECPSVCVWCLCVGLGGGCCAVISWEGWRRCGWVLCRRRWEGECVRWEGAVPWWCVFSSCTYDAGGNPGRWDGLEGDWGAHEGGRDAVRGGGVWERTEERLRSWFPSWGAEWVSAAAASHDFCPLRPAELFLVISISIFPQPFCTCACILHLNLHCAFPSVWSRGGGKRGMGKMRRSRGAQ